jgi:acetoacetate decarboxylase
MHTSHRTIVMVIVAAAIAGGAVMTEQAWGNAKYFDAEMLIVIWEADTDVIAELLPAPLEPYKRPLVIAFIADFPRTNIGVTYKMSSLNIVCEYQGEVGSYSVAMPEDDDHAVFSGREFLGFPKKMATLDFTATAETVSGGVERHGIRVFELQATKTDRTDFGAAEEILRELYPDTEAMDAVAFIIKGSAKLGGFGFDYPPQLIRQVTQFRPYHTQICDVEVTVRASSYEPWWEMLKPVRVLGAMYTRGNNEMLPGRVVATVDAMAFMKDMGYSYDRGFGSGARGD